MKSKILILLLFIVSTLSAQEKEVLGWVERVLLDPPGIILHAKLDTGADYSSIDAQDIVEFKRDGVKFVRFTVTNRYGEKGEIEAQVVRVAKIKRHSLKPLSRLVIRLGICIGSNYMEEEINLANRTHFEYQTLIGRSYLAGNSIIDPAVTLTTNPDCKFPNKELKKAPVSIEESSQQEEDSKSSEKTKKSANGK